jgi:Protein of unknown function (DUF1553)/Protein of unknown function (DUF1549)
MFRTIRSPVHIGAARIVCCTIVAALVFCLTSNGRADQPVSFGTEVMALLSKSGCNMGVCHGNKNGKGGFKLSLRGDDPRADFDVLTRDQWGRRVNRVDPERSLLLLKSTMQIPHEGGRRFKVDSPEHAALHRWIAAGMPADPPDWPTLRSLTAVPVEAYLTAPDDRVQLHVAAQFSDGIRRDVTAQATYELSNPMAEVSHGGRVQSKGFGEVTVIARYLDRQAPVRLAFIPARPEFVWNDPKAENIVDRHVFEKLRLLRMNPAPLAGDTVFVRRVFLDLLGLIPTADEARRFANDSRPGKRAELIDELLERPEFADHWALKWSDVLRNEEKTLDRKGVENFHAWIRLAIAEGRPVDRFVRELIAARGSTYSSPPANYWRAMREPFMRAESTAQVFLGVRLQCAKCHNHPFDRWTQEDYYRWANLFARVDYRIVENNRLDRNDSHEFDGEQIVFMSRKGEVKDPRTGRPAPPRFLSPEAAPLAADADRLLALADWITRPDNRLFVEAQVNRIWYHLLGQGIVDPIDDFRATNPPSNPRLLAALADEFVAQGFDLRRLIRTIMNSHTYQASSVPNATNGDDMTNFSQAREQRLSAEALVDAYSRAAEFSLDFSGYPAGMRAGELPGTQLEGKRSSKRTTAEQFLKLFGKPPRLQSCECERTNDPTLSQTFQLVSGGLVNELLTARNNRIGRLLAAEKSDAEIIDELTWATLSRPPAEEEKKVAIQYLSSSADRRERFEDLLWGLLNSNEFLLRR